jgi:hypothetical protein
MDLLDDDTGDMNAPSPLSGGDARHDAPVIRRGPGRPPGSRNKRQEAVLGMLLASHRHPLAVMMEVYSMTPLQLAKRLGMEPGDDDKMPNGLLLELFKLQIKTATDVAGLIVPKAREHVDGNAQAAVNLQINLGAQTGVSARSHAAEFAADGQDVPVIEGDAGAILAAWSDTPSVGN